MNKYNFSDLTNATATSIPAKTRTVQKSPLYARMEKLSVNSGFVIEKAQMASVAANVYATARRLGIKVTLRQIPEGVGVWRVRNSGSADTERSEASTAGRSTRGRKPAKKASRAKRATAA